MAEGLGVAASAIAVIDLSAKILELCSQYLKDVRNADNDIAKLKREVSNLKTVSESVQQLLDTPQGERLKTSQELRTTLKSGQNQLKSLKDTLHSHREKNKKWRKLRSLKWPFKSSDITNLVHDLARYTQVISLSLQVDQTATILSMDQRMVLDKLPIIEGAIFDSHAEEHSPTCLQGTRTDILRVIQNWAELPQMKALFWLNGMAGTGKSTISRTAARLLSDSNQLGASFFFKRGEGERAGISKFFPTIAAQLVKREPALAPYVKEAIDENPGISGERVENQFEKLILVPLSKISQDKRRNDILVIIIDALDECEQDEDIRLIISLLSRVNHRQLLKLRIFVTSRPELPIRLGFSTVKGTYLDLTLHKIPASVVERDLKAYFANELAKILDDYNNTVSLDRRLPPDWPGHSVIEDLASIASPLFIFAATVCRFLADRRNGTPDAKLRKVLQYKTRSQESKLDATYLPVLDQMVAGLSKREEDETLQEFRTIVGSIIVLFDPLSTSALAGILGIPQTTVDGRLDLLHSVLSVSSPNVPVKLFHLSFRDFLLDPEKRGRTRFWIDEKLTHRQLAKWCLDILSKSLRKDICEVRWPGTLLESIDPQVINKKLPPAVQYACLYWAHHLSQAGDPIKDGNQVHNFFKLHFLHWLEALSILRKPRNALSSVKLLHSLPQDKYTSEFSDIIFYSRKFAKQVPHSRVPLRIYIKAATYRWKYRHLYESDMPNWMLLGPEITIASQSSRHKGQISTALCDTPIIMSSDLRSLALAVLDFSEIGIWSVDTGDLRHTLKGHSDAIRSMAFSPNAKLLVSTSYDDDVRIWSAETGDCLQIIPHRTTKISFDRDGLFVLTDTDTIALDNTLQPSGASATPKEPFVLSSSLTLDEDIQSGSTWIALEGHRVLEVFDSQNIAIAGPVVAVYNHHKRRVQIYRIVMERLLELRPSV